MANHEPERIMPPTLKELALKYLRDKIAGGEWPSGYRLSDLLLSKEIGISRTPIREAINQLVAEGLVELRPHEGTFVRTISRRDIEELYELREILECYCARKAATAPSPELLVQLADNLARIEKLEQQTKPGQEFLNQEETRSQRQYDLAFHQALLAAAGNRKLEKIIGDSRLHSQLFSVLAGQMHIDSLHNAVEYHRRLFDAVKNRNPDAAEQAMREHMRCALQVALSRLPEKNSDSGQNIPPALRRFVDEK